MLCLDKQFPGSLQMNKVLCAISSNWFFWLFLAGSVRMRFLQLVSKAFSEVSLDYLSQQLGLPVEAVQTGTRVPCDHYLLQRTGSVLTFPPVACSMCQCWLGAVINPWLSHSLDAICACYLA